MNGQTEEKPVAITASRHAAEGQRGQSRDSEPPARLSYSLTPRVLNVFCACVWSRRAESVPENADAGCFGGLFFFIFPRDAVSGPGLSAAVELPRRRIETAGREVRTQQTSPTSRSRSEKRHPELNLLRSLGNTF